MQKPTRGSASLKTSAEVLVVRGPRAVEFGSRPVRAVPAPHASRTPPGARAASCLCLWDFSAFDRLFSFFFLIAP